MTSIIEIIFTKPRAFEINPDSKEKIKKDNFLSIRRPSNFHVYFSMRLTDGKLSEIEFTKARETKDIDKFKSSIIKWVDNELVDEVFLRFRIYDDYKDFNDFELVMKGMFELGQYLFNDYQIQTNKRKEFYEILVFKIQFEYKIIENKYEKELRNHYYNNYEKFITSILKSTQYSIGFKNDLIQFILNQYIKFEFYSDIGFPLTYEDVKLHAYLLFNKYCQENKQLTIELWNLYILYLNTQNVDIHFRNSINETMQSFAIQTDVKGFCRFLIQNSIEIQRFGYCKWHQDFELMFPENNSFILFCDKIPNTKQKLKDKLLEFHNELKSNNGEFISFDFEDLIDI